MTFRRYLIASVLAVATSLVFILISLTLHYVGDWPFIEKLLLSVAGTYLSFPLFLLWDLGRNTATIHENGERIAYVKFGAKIFYSLIFGGCGALILFAVVAAPREAETSILLDMSLRTFPAMLGLGSIYSCFFVFVAKVVWDDETINIPNYFLAMKRHCWSDLQSINVNPLMSDSQSLLFFEITGKARVFHFYEAHDEIIQLAESKLTDARTPRS